MIEVIEYHEIMVAWKEAALQWRNQTKLQLQIIDLIIKAICCLIKQTEVRTFMNKVKVCIGKWMFAIKILQDVEKFKKQRLSFKQSSNAETIFAGNVITKTIKLFMSDVNHSLSDLDWEKEQDWEYWKYKKWWDEGQIWVALCNAVGVNVLLLILEDSCAFDGHHISNKQ